MKDIQHAQSSVNKFGGKYEDYIKIHEWLDQTKAHVADCRHRAILHTSFGIFLCEHFFGKTITNSDGKIISIRDVAEEHILEDFGGKFIPTMQDFLQNMPIEEWMNNNGLPPSITNV